jgi:hypothetical protein
MKSSTKDKWLYDVSWSWSDSSSTHGKAGSRQKFQSLTLTMIHNPTRISLSSTTPFIQNRREDVSRLRSKLWRDLFEDLQRKIVAEQPNTALEPTAATPAVGGHTPIHACDFSRRGSALDR